MWDNFQERHTVYRFYFSYKFEILFVKSELKLGLAKQKPKICVKYFNYILKIQYNLLFYKDIPLCVQIYDALLKRTLNL